jgi:diacylglycerol kinase
MRTAKKFRCALRGILEAIRIENSFKVHFAAAVSAIILGFLLKITPDEWAVLALVIGLVLVSEMFNTVVELITKMVTREYNEHAKQLLDISAGAVLVSSLLSIIVGAVLFGGKLHALLFRG